MNPQVSQQIGLLVGFLFVFLTSFQVKTILGLIVLDLALGVASALKRKKFDLQSVGNFYLTNVIPYIVGYGALWLAISAIIPPSASLLSDALITMAWGVLVAALLGSVFSNLRELYPASGAGGLPFPTGVPLGQTSPPASSTGALPIQRFDWEVNPMNNTVVINGVRQTSSNAPDLEYWRSWENNQQYWGGAPRSEPSPASGG